MSEPTDRDRRVPGPPIVAEAFRGPGWPARRTLLGGALAVITGAALTGCGSGPSAASGSSGGSATDVSATPTSHPGGLVTGGVEASQGGAGAAASGDLPGLEERSGARIGVYALDTGSGRSLAHRDGERFAMCATFAVLAVGALLQSVGVDELTRRVDYDERDLVEPSPVTAGRTGSSLAGLCAAALQHGDATAANLVLAEVGGPAAVTRFAESLGDHVTRLDRSQPELSSVEPGDERDTTTPKLIGTALHTLVLGDVLTEVARRRLQEWLLGSATGDDRIKAAVPAGWRVANLTGDGSYGTANDVALVYPKGNRPPIVLSVMSDRDERDARADDAVVEQAASIALDAVLNA